MNNLFSIRDIMQTCPCLRISSPLKDVIPLFKDTSTREIVLLDEDEKVAGIFSKEYLLTAYLHGMDLNMPMGSHCEHTLHTVHVDMSLDELHNKISGNTDLELLVVVDDENQFIGLINAETYKRYADLMFSCTNTFMESLEQDAFSAVIIVNSAGQIKMINNTAKKQFGMVREAVFDRPLEYLIPTLDWRFILDSKLKRQILTTDCNNNSLVCNISPLVMNQKAIGAIIFAQYANEVSRQDALYAAEENRRKYRYYRTVLSCLYDGIFVMNSDKKIVYINDSICEILNISRDTSLNKPVEDLVVGGLAVEAFRTGKESVHELRLGHLQLPYRFSAIPLIRGKAILGVAGIFMYNVVGKMITLDKKDSLYDSQESSIDNKDAILASKTFADFVTINAQMNKLKKDAMLAAKSDATILITGESGTGKEVLASAIHNLSPRRECPFVTVNCAAIPESLLESEFFGYAPGSFTGALKKGKPGKLQLADKGTLFLDEIGDMSLNLQGKLLRALQTRYIEPVGGTHSIPIDIRILAATNQKLEEKISMGEFRLDLYYRLNLINLDLLPLRERREDIIPLILLFLEKYNSKYKKNIVNISKGVREICHLYSWPGNVRELENITERAVIFSSGNTILSESLPRKLQECNHSHFDITPKLTPEKSKESLSKSDIEIALFESGGNKSKTAAQLGISRTWLYEYIKRYNIEA